MRNMAIRFSFIFFTLIVLLMLSFVSAVDINFDCPDEILADEEFKCSLEVFDGDGEYDVKVEIKNGEDDIAEIWSEDKNDWQSAYYYLQDFISSDDEKDIRLRVSEEGDWEGVLKLRQGDKREFFDIEIEVEEGEEEFVEGVEEVYVEGVEEKEIILLEKPLKIISLNDNSEKKLVYESKDSKIMKYLPYAFSIFLIVLVGILFWERR